MAAIAGAIIAGLSLVSGEVARQKQNKAAKTEAKQAAVSNRQERIKALAKQRVVSSQQIAGAEASGTSGGSGAAGAVGASQSQTFANIGIQQQKEALNAQRNSQLNQAANFKGFSSTLASASSAFSYATGGEGNAFQDLGKKIKGTG